MQFAEQAREAFGGFPSLELLKVLWDTPWGETVKEHFGMDELQWDEEFVLERYEILYEAGLIDEAFADRRIADPPHHGVPGASLQLDHRRILATALGRLRGKFKYRPVIFDLMRAQFTLTGLQKTA